VNKTLQAGVMIFAFGTSMAGARAGDSTGGGVNPTQADELTLQFQRDRFELAGTVFPKEKAPAWTPKMLPQYSRSCEHLNLCWGECPKNRLVKAPDGEMGLNYLCAGWKRFYGHIQKDMPEILRRVREGAD
jgi:radical SAM protein with 4Fe4S-binding SPASM domain